MAHQSEPIVKHHTSHASGIHPGIHLVPALGIVVKLTGDLVKLDASAVEDIRDFRHRAGTATCQPIASHPGAVAHGIEGRVIDRRERRKIEDDDRNFRPLHDRQHGGAECVGGDVEENEIHICGAEVVASV